jgi:hypothetical protein
MGAASGHGRRRPAACSAATASNGQSCTPSSFNARIFSSVSAIVLGEWRLGGVLSHSRRLAGDAVLVDGAWHQSMALSTYGLAEARPRSWLPWPPRWRRRPRAPGLPSGADRGMTMRRSYSHMRAVSARSSGWADFERGDRQDLLKLSDTGCVQVLQAEVGASPCLVFVQRLAAGIEGPQAGDAHRRGLKRLANRTQQRLGHGCKPVHRADRWPAGRASGWRPRPGDRGGTARQPRRCRLHSGKTIAGRRTPTAG